MVPTAIAGLVFSISYVVTDPNLLQRLMNFWDRYNDPQGGGYMYIQIGEAIRTAGWWGHGLASVNSRLPMIHSDTLFTYLIYSLGWLAGCVIVLCAVLFMVQMVNVTLEIRDQYGKLVVSGISALFAVQLIWSLGMSLGVLPMTGMNIPLISYGGSQLLFQMAALGLILGVYRRKDMIRTQNKA